MLKRFFSSKTAVVMAITVFDGVIRNPLIHVRLITQRTMRMTCPLLSKFAVLGSILFMHKSPSMDPDKGTYKYRIHLKMTFLLKGLRRLKTKIRDVDRNMKFTSMHRLKVNIEILLSRFNSLWPNNLNSQCYFYYEPDTNHQLALRQFWSVVL